VVFEAAITQYGELRTELEHARAGLEATLRVLLHDIKDSISFIESRVKTSKSIQDNIIRDRAYPSEPLPIDEFLDGWGDIIGARVVAFYERDIKAIVRIITNSVHILSDQTSVEIEEKLTDRDILRGSKFGYRATHINFPLTRFAGKYAALNGRIPVEIQVRTLFSDTWARHSHKMIYKNEEEVPPETRRRFDAIAATLEGMDAQVEDIFAVNAKGVTVGRPIAEEISWIEVVDRIVSRTGLKLTEDDISGLFAAFSNAVHKATPEEFEKNVLEAWEAFGGGDFKRFRVNDAVFALKVALFAADSRKFVSLIPLYHRRLVNDIIYIAKSE